MRARGLLRPDDGAAWRYHVGMRDWLAEAKQLHAECAVLDGHADTPQRFVDEDFQWTSAELGLGQLSAETARQGGLRGGFLIAWPEPVEWVGRAAERTLSLIAAVHDQALRHADALAVCTSVAQVRAAMAAGRYAALIGVEGGHAIENSLDTLRQFHAAGARYMTLTWANANDWCGSSGAGARADGLTDFGREVVREMNRLGMIVDVSHVSDAAFADVLLTSSAPVIASHSSARALCGAARNVTDDMASALAAQGGMVMVNFFAAFLSDRWRADWNTQRDEREAAVDAVRAGFRTRGVPMPFHAEMKVEREFARRIDPVPFSVLIDHFDHLLHVAGIDHVGIGSDFDGIPLGPQGIESAADLPAITAALLHRGWQPHELRGMLGENLLRVMAAVEAHAA